MNPGWKISSIKTCNFLSSDGHALVSHMLKASQLQSHGAGTPGARCTQAATRAGEECPATNKSIRCMRATIFR